MFHAQVKSTKPVSSPLRIDGVPVDQLFESLYADFRDRAAARGSSLHFEIIAWDSLHAAADRAALRQTIASTLQSLISNSNRCRITLRAYPYDDDVSVMFEILCDRLRPGVNDPAGSLIQANFSLGEVVERMGGEWSVYESGDCVSGIRFRLPQWVCADEGLPIAV